MTPQPDPRYLDMLWDELRSAVIVGWRVKTPEVQEEIERAKQRLIEAMEGDTS